MNEYQNQVLIELLSSIDTTLKLIALNLEAIQDRIAELEK